jgi:uncharacterized protein (TIGR02757 family)
MSLSNREEYLRSLAAKYETASFVEDDPIQFAHATKNGDENLETTAFVASALSYGSRKQFIPKIAELVRLAGGNMHEWVKNGAYEKGFALDDRRSFYRLFSHGAMRVFFDCLKAVLADCGTISGYLRRENATTGMAALEALCRAFSASAPIVPKDTTSACKRLCLFLRWMARDSSPVDFGIWSSWMDKRTLVMPLDVHVVRQAIRLGIVKSPSASMRNALAITAYMRTVFPDDPLKGDFALYGFGIAGGAES